MAETKYLDFDLALVKAGKRTFRAHVIDSPAGTAQCDFQLPFTLVELDNFVLRVGRTRRGVRRLESPEMEAAKQFGGQLFQAVFSGDVQACLRSSLDQARAKNTGLRIRLRMSEAPELSNLPWEFLYNPSANRFLALSVSTPVVRYLELPETIQPVIIDLPLNILVMISAPSDYAPLDVEHEWHNLQEALQPLTQRGAVMIERLPQATLRALQTRLRKTNYHIFHFIGHGSFDQRMQDGLLLLEDEQGRGRPISGQVLGALLHDEERLRLVVLNACEGARTGLADPFAGVAQSLVQQGLPAVIAMQFEVTDQAAITFSRDFYAAVADGLPLDAAIAEARKGIYASGNDVEWGTPVLFLRVPDGQVFSITPSAPAEPAAQPERTAQPSLSDSQASFKVDKLYYDALSAYLIEDYAKAVELFGQVNALRPNFLDTPKKLAEARRRLELPGLRQHAEKALEAGHWAAAIGALEKICALAPEDHAAPRQLAEAQQQAQLASLYASARQFIQEGQWAAALRAWEQIDAQQAGYPDPEALRQAARDGAAAEKLRLEAEALYVEALTHLDSGDWAAGAEKLRSVQALLPGMHDSAALLARAEKNLAVKAEVERHRAEAEKAAAARKAAEEMEARRQAAVQAERERQAALLAESQRVESVKAAAPLVWKEEAAPALQPAPKPVRVRNLPEAVYPLAILITGFTITWIIQVLFIVLVNRLSYPEYNLGLYFLIGAAAGVPAGLSTALGLHWLGVAWPGRKFGLLTLAWMAGMACSYAIVRFSEPRSPFYIQQVISAMLLVLFVVLQFLPGMAAVLLLDRGEKQLPGFYWVKVVTTSLGWSTLWGAGILATSVDSTSFAWVHLLAGLGISIAGSALTYLQLRSAQHAGPAEAAGQTGQVQAEEGRQRQAAAPSPAAARWVWLARRWALPLLVVGVGLESSRLYLMTHVTRDITSNTVFAPRGGLAGMAAGACLAIALAWLLFFTGRRLGLLNAGAITLVWGVCWSVGVSLMSAAFHGSRLGDYLFISLYIYTSVFGFLPALLTTLLLPGGRPEKNHWLRAAGRAALAGLGWAVILILYYNISIGMGAKVRGIWTWIDGPWEGSITGIAGLLWMYWLVLRPAPLWRK